MVTVITASIYTKLEGGLVALPGGSRACSPGIKEELFNMLAFLRGLA